MIKSVHLYILVDDSYVPFEVHLYIRDNVDCQGKNVHLIVDGLQMSSNNNLISLTLQSIKLFFGLCHDKWINTISSTPKTINQIYKLIFYRELRNY